MNMKKFLSVMLCVCMIASLFTFGVSAANESKKEFDFSNLTQEMGSMSGITGFLNVPVSTHDSYGKLYYWAPKTGVFGKNSSDTALYFKSEWEQSSLPSDSGANVITNPLINVGDGTAIAENQYYHISFELARESGSFGGYVQLRPNSGKYTNLGISFPKKDNATDYIEIKDGSTSLKKVEMNYKKWYKFDLVFKPSDESEDKDGSSILTRADVYVDGNLVVANLLIDANTAEDGTQRMTDLNHFRMAFDPRKSGSNYPKTETYMDNLVMEVLNSEPQIVDFSLTHTDETLNSYIDNETHTIGYYGQTVSEMKDGLGEDNGAQIKFVDLSGKEITDETVALLNCYVKVEKSDQTVYYRTENKINGVNAKEYDVDYETKTVVAYSYTPIDVYKQKFEAGKGYTLSVKDADGNEVTNGDIKAGYKLEAVDDATGETAESYTIKLYTKDVHENFDTFNKTKFYYGGSNNAQNDWSWVSANFDSLTDGLKAEDVAYFEPVDVAGRGKVLHIYSKGAYASAYSHITFVKNTLPKAEYYGKQFVIEYSAMVPTDDDSVRCQLLTQKTGSTSTNYTNPVVLEKGSVKVWGDIVADYKPGEWQDIIVYNDTITGEYTAFVNGNKVKTSTNSMVKNISTFTSLRMIQHFCTNNETEYNAYVDNFAIYGVGGLTESFLKNIDVSLKSDDYIVEDGTINGYFNMTVGDVANGAIVADGATVKMYNADATEAKLTDKAVKGMYLKVTSADASTSKMYPLNIEHHEISDIDYTVNGMHVDGKFAKGTVKASVNVDAYAKADVTVILAQYSNNYLIDCKVEEQKNILGKDKKVEATLEIDDATDSTLKIMVWENTDNAKPLVKAVELVPFETGKITSVSKTYPNYSQKAITFSYDDGVSQDAQLIEIFKKYNLRATFNIIANWIGTGSETMYAERYKGFEVATHSNTHPRMYVNDSSEIEGGYTPMTLEQCVAEFSTAQTRLKNVFGSAPRGGAWPYTAPYNRDFYQELLSDMQEMGIMYMRPTPTKSDFDFPSNWMDWRANCHHDSMESFANKFIALDTKNELKLFYVWGHAYEFDSDRDPENTAKVRWEKMDELCSKFADRDAYWSATNIEVYDYATAMEKAVIDYDKNTITNPTNVDLYFVVNGERVKIAKNTTAQF